MMLVCCVFFFKQKTAYEMRISDWSSDVCSSDLIAYFIEIDRIGLAQYVAALLRHFAGDADREAGAGEGVATDEDVGEPQFLAEQAHFVLEQLAQGFDKLHVHPLGQPADIVVALDRHARSAGEADAFDHVGIKRALREEIGATDLLRFFLEHIAEFAAAELALLFGIGDAGQAAPKAFLGVHHAEDRKSVVWGKGVSERV